MGNKRVCVYSDPDAKPNMGVDRSLRVLAEFSPEDGLTISGSDSTSWPERDFTWEYRVPARQTDKLREALEAKAGEDTFELFLSRFKNCSYDFWLGFAAWLNEHGIQFTASKEWHDN